MRTSYSSVLMEPLSDLESLFGMIAQTLAFSLFASSLPSILVFRVMSFWKRIAPSKFSNRVLKCPDEAFQVRGCEVVQRYVPACATVVLEIRIYIAFRWWCGRDLGKDASANADIHQQQSDSSISRIFSTTSASLLLDRQQK